MKMHSKKVSLTGIQHEFDIIPHDDSVEISLKSIKGNSRDGFHYFVPHDDVDASIIHLVAIRNANRLGQVMSPQRVFYVYENRYVGLRLAEDEDGYYTLLIVADMNMLDLVKRPTMVYGLYRAIGHTVHENKHLLREFNPDVVKCYTRKPITLEDLKIGEIYDSPIAHTRWKLSAFLEGNKKVALYEVYDDGKISPYVNVTRTAALVRWVNGDRNHASVDD